MLWLALRFAALPLEVYSRATARGTSRKAAAFAVVEGARGVVACSEEGLSRGIKPGMPAAAATALASDLQIVPRDTAAEDAALERIAAWAVQFTPAVSIVRPGEIVLELEGSLTIFGGLKALWSALGEGLKTLGFTASMACAPTPLAAQWFARAGLAVRLRHLDALRSSLRDLPVEVMHTSPETLALLQNIGVHTIADCLALPRDALTRRVGRDFLDDLDRALGVLADPRIFFSPPTAYKASQPLPAPAHEAEMLLFAARRLLVELCGFLTATANGVQRLVFIFEHHKREPTKLVLSLVAATRDAEHLTNVLREKLDRTELPCPATAIVLESELMLPLASRNLSLLPDAGQQEEPAARLFERLRARLGDEAVLGLRRYPDHRPERAWRACEPGERDASTAALAGRPLWLLPEPRRLNEIAAAPCYDGRITLLAGPERIESGWWDGHDVTRDYFVATSTSESLLWIYRERNADAGWYLHGFFA